MTQVWQELEEALYSSDNFSNIMPLASKDSGRSTGGSPRFSIEQRPRRSTDHDYSQSFVSIDGVGFQRFRIEMDGQSFQSSSLRAFETDRVSIDVDKNNLRGKREETSREQDLYAVEL